MTPAIGAHRRRRRFDLARPADRSAAVATAIAVALALVIWSPSFGGTAPGDPAAVAGDARLSRCGGTVADVEYAFAIPHARDYHAYLPAMDDFSELDLDAPALVVVYRGRIPVAAPAGPSPTPRPAGSTERDLCVYVGAAGQGELNYYTRVSVAGLRATPKGPVLVAGPQS